MTTETDIREFLTTRRAKLTPERVGLPTFGRQRRVAGLRREEVALLAGISVEYYTRLERGNARGVSESVLQAVSTALQLDEAEHAHLIDLCRTANAEQPPRRVATPQKVRPSIARIVDAIVGIPAAVRNGRLDIVYANDLGRALYSDLYRDPRGPNTARFTFLDPRSRLYWIDWERAASDTVAVLRAEAGRNPSDRSLSDLIGELTTRSEEFAVRWAAHDVKNHRSGTKQLRHPLVGELTLTFEALELPADPGLTLQTYAAEPGTPSEARLRELGEWVRTRAKLAGVDAIPTT
jgi:transcriptional regulator with XRE-family HTH domain